LFKRGVGRTDLWGGDEAKLKDSVRRIIKQLNPSYTMVPGHGPNSTLALEAHTNPWINAWM
jgi:glyoxylase-like metal-dependent hydrolase (beta-lactamase superfamily II)